jgi:hypothetical protein
MRNVLSYKQNKIDLEEVVLIMKDDHAQQPTQVRG